ncbi:MAG: folate family ECF transporter S component [Eubacteriales bacterium]
MAKFTKLFKNKKTLRGIGGWAVFLGLAYAVSIVFLMEGSSLYLPLAVSLGVAALGILLIVATYKAIPGEMPKADIKSATKKLTITAVLLGLTAITKFFSLNIVIFGGSGMRVGLGGVFTTFPAILFGPIYGGMASAASDILGCIISPIGAYNPLFTLTAFLGGLIKGLVWLALKKSSPRRLRLSVAAAFGVVAILGGVFYASLAADGVSSSVIARYDSVKSKAYVQETDVSFFTGLITKRVRSSDTYTLSETSGETVYIPSSALVDGVSAKVALKISALGENSELKEVYIPDSLAKLDITPLKEKGVKLYLTEKSKLFDEIKDSGITFALVNEIAETQAVMDSENPVFGGMRFVSDDNYRKNLAGYINFATFGLMAVGVFGLFMALAEYIWSRLKKDGALPSQGVKIFAAIFIAEMVQTTINTYILKVMTMSSTWAAYPFLIVWIPRAAEGLIICLIQAYLITLLYSLLKSRFSELKISGGQKSP